MRLLRVGAALPDGFDVLRDEARGQGHGMLDRLAQDWDSAADRYTHEGEALLAAFVDGALAGIGGLTHDPVRANFLRMC